MPAYVMANASAVPMPGFLKALGIVLIAMVIQVGAVTILPLVAKAVEMQLHGQTTPGVELGVVLAALAMSLLGIVVTIRLMLPTTLGNAIGIVFLQAILGGAVLFVPFLAISAVMGD